MVVKLQFTSSTTVQSSLKKHSVRMFVNCLNRQFPINTISTGNLGFGFELVQAFKICCSSKWFTNESCQEFDKTCVCCMRYVPKMHRCSLKKKIYLPVKMAGFALQYQVGPIYIIGQQLCVSVSLGEFNTPPTILGQFQQRMVMIMCLLSLPFICLSVSDVSFVLPFDTS